jgi:hypothetical protein
MQQPCVALILSNVNVTRPPQLLLCLHGQTNCICLDKAVVESLSTGAGPWYVLQTVAAAVLAHAAVTTIAEDGALPQSFIPNTALASGSVNVNCTRKVHIKSSKQLQQLMEKHAWSSTSCAHTLQHDLYQRHIVDLSSVVH